MRILIILSLVVVLAGCAKKQVAGGDPAKGRQIFQSACAVCHRDDSTAKKTGPGLLGLYKLPALPNGEAVTDANVERWVRNGGGLMPPFKNALTPEQMKDLLAYLKTL